MTNLTAPTTAKLLMYSYLACSTWCICSAAIMGNAAKIVDSMLRDVL